MKLFAFFRFLWNSVVCFFRRIFVGMSKDVVNAIDLSSERSSCVKTISNAEDVISILSKYLCRLNFMVLYALIIVIKHACVFRCETRHTCYTAFLKSKP